MGQGGNASTKTLSERNEGREGESFREMKRARELQLNDLDVHEKSAKRLAKNNTPPGKISKKLF